MPELTGFWGGMLESVAALIGACAAFQTWVEAEDAEEAGARVHRLMAPNDGTVWPCAVVTYGEGMSLDRVSAQGFGCRSGGSVMVMFEGEAGESVESDPEADQVAFANAVEAICAEMVEKSAGEGHVQLMGLGPEGPFEAYGVRMARKGGEHGAELVVYRWVWRLRLP